MPSRQGSKNQARLGIGDPATRKCSKTWANMPNNDSGTSRQKDFYSPAKTIVGEESVKEVRAPAVHALDF